MRYPFRTSFAPGAPRPDLAALVMHHAWASLGSALPERRDVGATGVHYAAALQVESTPEQGYGTLIPYPSPDTFLDALEAGDRILSNHRHRAHRAWARSLGLPEARADERAWMCARRHCGLNVLESSQ